MVILHTYMGRLFHCSNKLMYVLLLKCLTRTINKNAIFTGARTKVSA